MSQTDEEFVVLNDHDFADFNPTGLLPQSPEEILRIRKWLQPTDYEADSSEYNNHLGSIVPGTGNWLQETESYQQWLHSPDRGALWLKGVAGSGKSVIAAHVAAIFSAEKVPVLTFFFRQIILTNKTPQSLLRDWLSQLLDFSPSLQLRLKDLVEARRTLDSIAFDELWDVLVSALCELKRVYCIADALDEMDLGNEELMRKLAKLGQTNPSTIKVFVTSRPLPYLEKALSCQSVNQILLQANIVDQDIHVYLRTRLGQTTMPLDLQSTVYSILSRKAQGLFLYARLMLDEILEVADDPKKVGLALEKLPTGLSQMYSSMLVDHSQRSGTPQELQLFILQCVIFSSRPLRLLELAAITDFVNRNKETRLIPFSQMSPLDTKCIIRLGCGPLLVILKDETVSIIHHSLTEFLIDSGRGNTETNFGQFPFISSHDTQFTLAKICAEYLVWGLQRLGSASNDKHQTAYMPENARMMMPFLDYAIKNLYYHILEAEETKDLFPSLDLLWKACNDVWLFYLTVLDPKFGRSEPSPLHVVASKGLAAYTKHLVHLGQDINGPDQEGRTPLHHAATNGHGNVVRMLLECGARNNPDDRYGLTPLHLAAKADHFDVVKILLVSGVPPLTPKTKENPGRRCGKAPQRREETAVEYASTYGHTKTVAQFLQFLDVESLSKALCWAAEAGKTETVLAILEDSRVDVNKIIDDKTPLHIASHSRDLESMQKLLQLGADVNIKCNAVFGKHGVRIFGVTDSLKYSPLHVYTKHHHESQHEPNCSTESLLKGFRMLLDAGCDINDYDGSGCTTIHLALRAGWGIEVVRFLLEHGANPSMSAVDGSTVLHCSSQKSKELIGLLVMRGADINAQRPTDGQTPLHGSLDPLPLIQYGADCNAQDFQGNTPLHIAMENLVALKSTVKVLLENGADPNIKNRKGYFALHQVQHWSRQSDLLPAFVNANVDFESKTPHGCTVLLQAMENTVSLQVVDDFLDAGADITARDFEGRTILHSCCTKDDSVDILRHLIKRGANPLWIDFAGNTLFHQVARQQASNNSERQLALLEYLLELGLSPSARNNAGDTPFHTAASMYRGDKRWSTDKTDPYKFLLEQRCNLNVNDPNYKGVRAIHLAATLSEHQVRQLFSEGADPTLCTIEGLSPLHIASRCRQSNIVGMLVEEYAKLGKLHMIDQRDIKGNTALHHAVRSGRAETVSFLLTLGAANVNLRDARGLTPLDVCSEIPEEDIHWKYREHDHRRDWIRATGTGLADQIRPWGGDNESRRSKKFVIESEADKFGVREIVRLLVGYGADISFMRGKYLHKEASAFTRALNVGCEAMADELIVLSKFPNTAAEPRLKDDELEECSFHDSSTHFVEKYVLSRARPSSNMLKESFRPSESNLSIFQALLYTENEEGITEFIKSGADLLEPGWKGKSCMTLLVEFGYATLLKKHCLNLRAMEDLWIKETGESDDRGNLVGRLQPMLLIACQRTLPNLDVIKVLVEDFHFDINAICDPNDRTEWDDFTAVHALARSDHWWHSSALEYLLQHKVSLEIKNEALHIAIESKQGEVATEILLRYGADPNFINKDGLTCLNKASRYPSIIRDLIKYGANVSAGKKPFVFDAIESLNLETINLLVEMGTVLNIKPEPEKKPEPSGNNMKKKLFRRRRRANSKDLAETSYPIHFAASSKFNTVESKPKAVPIIEMLLQGGANPFLAYNNDGDSVLHEICLSGGIIEPFLSLPSVNLEARDSSGRTLLLAACSTTPDYFNPSSSESTGLGRSNIQLLLDHGADITAVDDAGRNALHLLMTCSERHESIRAYPSGDLRLILENERDAHLVGEKDDAGATPLHHALRNKQLWAVEPLLTKGSDPLMQDPEGNSALHHLAAQFTNPSSPSNTKSLLAEQLFQKFLALGVDINAPNKAGETPIFNIISSGSIFCPEYIQMFEQKGANLMVRNLKRQGLLRIAAKAGCVGVFDYFLSKGLNAMLEDDENRSALDVASASGNGSRAILEIFKRDV